MYSTKHAGLAKDAPAHHVAISGVTLRDTAYTYLLRGIYT